MNLDLASTLNFGDSAGLKHFFLDHYVVHNQVAQALSARGSAVGTVGLVDVLAESDWLELMARTRKTGSKALADWLTIHYNMHVANLSAIGGASANLGSDLPDLSTVDFADPSQFYDWMYTHQQVHDYEQQALGLT